MLAIFYIVTNRAAEAEPYLKSIAETTKDVGASLALADYYAGTKRVPQAIALLEKLAANKAAYAAARTASPRCSMPRSGSPRPTRRSTRCWRRSRKTTPRCSSRRSS